MKNQVSNRLKILVTGSVGYIGSIAVKNLLAKNHKVVIFDNLSTGFEKLVNKNAKFVKGDLLDPASIEFVLKNAKIDAAMHFAAFSLVGESVENPQKYFTNNISGSLNLFRATLNNDVKKLIFSSTAAIFGEPKNPTGFGLESQTRPRRYHLRRLAVGAENWLAVLYGRRKFHLDSNL